jgi:hypothetical protein
VAGQTLRRAVYKLRSSGSPYRIRLARDWSNKSGPIDVSSQERSTTEPKRRLTRCRIDTVSCRLWRLSDNSHPDTCALVHPMAASSQAASTGGRRRKTHNKSRNGCAQCKKRHYKVSLFLLSVVLFLLTSQTCSLRYIESSAAHYAFSATRSIRHAPIANVSTHPAA